MRNEASISDQLQTLEYGLVTFCIPTLRPNRMPDTNLWFPLEDDLDWLDSKIRSLYKGLPEVATSAGKNMVFLSWGHVLEKTPAVDTTPLMHAYEFLERWQGLDQSKESAPKESIIPEIGIELHRTQSVLSASTPLLVEDGDVSGAISDAYDRCIGIVRSLEQAYVIVTADIDYIPVSLMTSYPMVPYFVTDLEEGSVINLGLFQTNFRPLYLAKVDEASISQEQFDSVRLRRHRTVIGDPWATHTLLHVSARRALEITGDAIGCVTQAFTAGESLIDALLLSLFWERQGETINTIRLDLDNLIAYLNYPRTTKWRSDNVLKDLLRFWYPGDRRRPLLEWFDRYGKVRNRAVHLGREPKELECVRMLQHLEALIVYVGDVLAHEGNRFQYPKSSLLFLGEDGLKRRNAFSKRTKKIIDEGKDEFWAESFAGFSREVVEQIWG